MPSGEADRHLTGQLGGKLRKFLNLFTVLAILAVLALIGYALVNGLLGDLVDPFTPPGNPHP